METGRAVLVSSCLTGVPCRWHGRRVPYSSFLKKYITANPDIKLIPVCPETLGGLPTPRPPVKRRNGRVYETCADKAHRKDVTGREVTEFFRDGAAKVLELAISQNINTAIFCKWSPSCDKTGITGKLLAANGIKIINTW
ncbi:MAG: DUF523 domain-containing protein [Desulfobacteraceae bacterium]|nr:DUF523 domain-containing protein [Desulfobacteraceae bacterium]